MGEFGETFELLRAAAGPRWQALTGHDFFEDLALGTLPEGAFARHLALEYHRMVLMARGWALAVARATNWDEMQGATRALAALVLDEIELQAVACDAAGLDDAALDAAGAAPETLAAGQPLYEAALGGDLVDLLVALVPGSVARAEIGAALADFGPTTPHGDWIEAYASPEFHAACGEIGGLLDAAVALRLGPEPETNPRWPQLAARFAAAVERDRALWDAALRG